MMDGTDGLGTYLKVYDGDGYVVVQASDEPHVDGAVSAYLDNGRDRLIRMTMLDGEEYVTLASQIRSWMISTPAGRRRSFEVEKASADEVRANRQAAGIWEDD